MDLCRRAFALRSNSLSLSLHRHRHHKTRFIKQGYAVKTSSQNTTTTKPPKNFLDLPVELHLHIIELAVTEDESIQITRRCNSRLPDIPINEWNTTTAITRRKQPAITQASRSIRADALPLYYKRNIFMGSYCKAGALPQLKAWLYAIGEKNRRSIYKLLVSDRSVWDLFASDCWEACEALANELDAGMLVDVRAREAWMLFFDDEESEDQEKHCKKRLGDLLPSKTGAKAPKKDYFTTKMPAELMMMVTDLLDEQDILALRSALPKIWESFVVSVLGKKFTRLYVYATHGSLSRFARICATPFFQRYVTEVVFVCHSLLERSVAPKGVFTFSSFFYQLYEPQYSEDYGQQGFERRGAKGENAYEPYREILAEYKDTPLNITYTLSTGFRSLPRLRKVYILPWQSRLNKEGINLRTTWYTSATPDEDITSDEAASGFLADAHEYEYWNSTAHDWVRHLIGALSIANIRELHLGDLYCATLQMTLPFEAWMRKSDLFLAGVSHVSLRVSEWEFDQFDNVDY
ncbi:hypothetical protein M409DRAFT_53870 [Zasmidium cellare ATCC 36951]|uniref:F-box domain-containing protein n=1 Tax=Zasmidium cellare ATCC 36951 TaxID=1080233 RepID=A0A6A6CL39_ZASCE|nr:uncharacterized protein M409DRAFT_53870 [Zasmidium cellare ATCC 36951]KAF2167924.1 hypothetical protein M409DRAFT_53870 [Zasmidium cellare ATCC 36951]